MNTALVFVALLFAAMTGIVVCMMLADRRADDLEPLPAAPKSEGSDAGSGVTPGPADDSQRPQLYGDALGMSGYLRKTEMQREHELRRTVAGAVQNMSASDLNLITYARAPAPMHERRDPNPIPNTFGDDIPKPMAFPNARSLNNARTRVSSPTVAQDAAALGEAPMPLAKKKATTAKRKTAATKSRTTTAKSRTTAKRTSSMTSAKAKGGSKKGGGKGGRC